MNPSGESFKIEQTGTWRPPNRDGDNFPDAAAAARARIAALHGEPAPADTTAPAAAEPAPPQVASTTEAPVARGFSYDPLRTLPQPEPLAHQPKAQPKPDASHIKPTPSRLKPILTALGTFALLIVLFKSQVIISQISYLTQPKSAPAVVTPAVTVSAEPTMSIPKINVTAPLVFEPSTAEAAVQKGLQNGVVHYGNTAVPGQPGNSVIVGHSSNDWWEPGNYKFVFVLLDKLVPGDTYTVDYKGTKYVYQVTETMIVEPTNLSVLAQTPEPTMTLITCTPPGTSWKRFIVKAKQISPAPASVAASTTGAAGADAANLPGNSPSFVEGLKGIWHNFVGLFSGDEAAPNEPAPAALPGT